MDFSSDPAIGVWSTERDCYEFLASQSRPGSRTLETGSGVSTVLFAALGAVHTCVTPSREEADAILGYCATRGIEVANLRFLIGGSDRVLPGLDGEFDVVFIDGGHGYPTPIIDWYYGAGRLVAGGVMVLDDTQLPAVAHLSAVLARHPGWVLVRRSAKWSAWRRVGEEPLGRDWFDQPWLVAPLPTDALGLATRAVRRLGRDLAAIAGRARGPRAG